MGTLETKYEISAQNPKIADLMYFPQVKTHNSIAHSVRELESSLRAQRDPSDTIIGQAMAVVTVWFGFLRAARARRIALSLLSSFKWRQRHGVRG